MLRRTLVAIFAVAALAACGRPPATQYSLVYSGRSETLPRLDPSILAGRTILIDPGHGGHFAGTQGHGGLEESKVNLGVSLYLWGLLTEAGADAHLTRSAERDFLHEADSTLAGDLAARVAIIDSIEPEIFVSVHHNAEPGRSPDKNMVETYYRLGDPASRDLAFAVHRHLMRNLGITAGEVRPGNYFVLRNSDVPSILGESSYLTHPPVEDVLKLSEKQRLEAEAYFLGILEYFSRGTPRIARAAPYDTVFTKVPLIAFDLEDVGGAGIDPASVEVELDGRPVHAMIADDGSRVRYQMPWDAANGWYELTLRARNLRGNGSRIARVPFRIDHAADMAVFDIEPQAPPPAGGTVRVRARILDRRGLAVADSTAVVAAVSGGAAPESLVVTRGVVEVPVTVPAGSGGVTLELSAGTKTFTTKLARGGSGVEAFRVATVADARTRIGVADADVMVADSVIATASVGGRCFISTGAPDTVWVRALGYRPRVVATSQLGDSIGIEPWMSGALLGRRFIIDPEGGFGPEPGMGPLGLTGPFVNLRVAQYLAEFLTRAGAHVRLTRDSEETLSTRDVVVMTNAFGADRYIEIRHRAMPAESAMAVSAFHFPGSGNGRAMARAVQNATARYLDLPAREPSDLVTFPLQQTACPAIVLQYPSIADEAEELRLAEPWYQRAQAYGAFLGIADHFAPADSASLDVELADSTVGVVVTLDRTWSLLSDHRGRVRFERLPAGAFTLSIRRPGVPAASHRVRLRGGESIRFSEPVMSMRGGAGR